MVATLTACGTGTGPSNEFVLNFSTAPIENIVVGGDTIIFTPESANVVRETLGPVRAEADEGVIRVFGSFVQGCPQGQPMLATMDRRPEGVVLVISSETDAPTCRDLPVPYTYEARFTRVPSGVHTVAVERLGDVLWGDGLVMEQQVEVP